MAKWKKCLAIVLWLACGYINAAVISGDLYAEFHEYEVETKMTASRKGLLLGLLGPASLIPAAFAWAEGRPPMWDWPVHIFERRSN